MVGCKLLNSRCARCEERMPEYVEACLRGAGTHPEYADVRRHLRACPACAAGFAELLALVAWREAEDPFDGHALHDPGRLRVLLGLPEGRPCDKCQERNELSADHRDRSPRIIGENVR